jgi:hypothetical protein
LSITPAFAVDGGKPIAEQINAELLKATLISFRKPDNRRVSGQGSHDKRGGLSGWAEMRNRLIGGDGAPMLYFFDCCKASIGTIPRLQHGPSKGEDIDTESVDHAADETRYACMARPWLTPEPRGTDQGATDLLCAGAGANRHQRTFPLSRRCRFSPFATCRDVCSMSAIGENVLQNVFWSWNEEEFSATRAESVILILRLGQSDSIIAEFPWPGGLAGTFATQSGVNRTNCAKRRETGKE